MSQNIEPRRVRLVFRRFAGSGFRWWQTGREREKTWFCAVPDCANPEKFAVLVALGTVGNEVMFAADRAGALDNVGGLAAEPVP